MIDFILTSLSPFDSTKEELMKRTEFNIVLRMVILETAQLKQRG